jgi:hypothetical protein
MLNNAEYLGPGIVVYRDVFPESMNLINRLEDSLGKSDGKHKWKQATTGYSNSDLKYRDCFDFKIKKNSDDSLMLIKELKLTKKKKQI